MILNILLNNFHSQFDFSCYIYKNRESILNIDKLLDNDFTKIQ